ncbi:uncharacterized protein LOC118349388 [Juglans regia]|uniref:Uncharacterized protein LOC118349388 n=1 Tax=Juglans regia TaxID=51240 RepID=A0A6P9EM47_JUGRE|nr:uncharacterized protein LOC118349388 [Juglans regia]
MFLVRLLLPASIVMTVCFATFASGAPDQLPPDEVQALRDILHTLGKKDWDFSNPCNSNVPPTDDIKEIAAVSCSNCTFGNGNVSYRVVGIGKDWNSSKSTTCHEETKPLRSSTYPKGSPPAVAVVKSVLKKISTLVTLLDVTTYLN